MALLMPPALRKPDILDLPCTTEIFADLGVIMDRGETIRILLAAEVANGYGLVAKIVMPHTGFRRSLAWAAADIGFGLATH